MATPQAVPERTGCKANSQVQRLEPATHATSLRRSVGIFPTPSYRFVPPRPPHAHLQADAVLFHCQCCVAQVLGGVVDAEAIAQGGLACSSMWVVHVWVGGGAKVGWAVQRWAVAAPWGVDREAWKGMLGGTSKRTPVAAGTEVRMKSDTAVEGFGQHQCRHTLMSL